MHHDPHRDPRRRHPHRSSRARGHPRFHPSGRDAGGHAHRPAGALHARSSGHRRDTQRQGCPSCRYRNSPWTPRPLPARRSSTCSASLPSSRPTCAPSARPKESSRQSGVAPIAVVHHGSTWKTSGTGLPGPVADGGRPRAGNLTWHCLQGQGEHESQRMTKSAELRAHSKKHRYPTREIAAGSLALRSSGYPYMHVRAVWAFTACTELISVAPAIRRQHADHSAEFPGYSPDHANLDRNRSAGTTTFCRPL